ncbi:basic amino acid ABC transporter substrate-binding protein [Pseudalkalibacillus berkeleyi]|uniref:Basic amino acid ABC transporter substrate-binding protein n=1 Tax=Pseudalkalibacillus berkeleyi TaxID=1069813 RepID=A0ABS9GVW2_9BACL|nr:basic amino acid ABC transporter substrate-binding protein [Pseudalkalibacillus berkeleyi]MCF6136824.1 basic amino acid ABC transporter substrate-binding protein [Pseudalkalibacillus berkeleyi]
MKKSIKSLFALTMVGMLAILAACGGSDSGSGDKGKKLEVVTDAAYAPFEYMDKGEITGFDIDFLNAVMKEAGYESEFKNIGWDPLFAEIQGEKADLAISAITINEERKESFDFSTPYFESTNMILVPEDSDIKSAEDLKGKKVAVQNGTTGQAAVESILGKNHKNIKKFENNTLAIMELIQGGADAVVADNTVVIEYAKNNPDKKLKTIKDEKNFESEFYGLMFPKGSDLKADFDKAVKEVINNGTYSEIYKEWFGDEPDLEALKKQMEK